MSTVHSLAAGTSGGIHVPHQWEYANAAARTAATGFVASDVKKLALQSNLNAIFMLTSTAPTWKLISPVSGTVTIAISAVSAVVVMDGITSSSIIQVTSLNEGVSAPTSPPCVSHRGTGTFTISISPDDNLVVGYSVMEF